MRKLEKKILGVWALQGVLISLVLGTGLGALIGYSLNISVALSIAAAFSILLIILTGYMSLRYKAWSFELREDHLYLEHGVLKKVKTMVPFVRIQHVDTQKGIIERLVGLSRVIVYTAGSRGADVTIPGLVPQDADDIQEKLRDVAIESEDRDGV